MLAISNFTKVPTYIYILEYSFLTF